MSDRDDIFKSAATSHQIALSQIEEVHKAHKMLEAAMRQNPVVEARKALDAAMAGRNMLAELDKQQKALEAVMRHSSSTEMQKALDANRVRNAMADFEAQQKDLEAAIRPTMSLQLGVPQRPISSTKTNPHKTESFLSSIGDLGKIIRQKRKEMRLTQQQFADITGVGRRFVSELEAGKPTLEFGRVLKVCQSVGIDLAVVQR